MRSFHNSRTGWTLIEVLAGLTLMGTLLSAAIMAYGRHVRQIHRTQERQRVMRHIEPLLTDWFQNGVPLQVPAAGELPGCPGYTWSRMAPPLATSRLTASSSPVTSVTIVIQQHTSATESRQVCRFDLAVESGT